MRLLVTLPKSYIYDLVYSVYLPANFEESPEGKNKEEETETQANDKSKYDDDSDEDQEEEDDDQEEIEENFNEKPDAEDVQDITV